MADANYFIQKIRKKLLADADEDIVKEMENFRKVRQDPALAAEYEKGQTSKEIFFRTLDGKTHIIKFNPLATILSLKAVIAKEITYVDVADVVVMYGGKTLCDEKTLSDCLITPESMLHVVIRLRGGGCDEREAHLKYKVAEKVDSVMKNINMVPEYNRVYSDDGKTQIAGFTPTTWEGALTRGGSPYYCPKGWMRYSIKVSEDAEDFDKKYGKWKLAYHGTKVAFLEQIMQDEKLDAARVDCFKFPHPVVYFSPSVEYCAAERYAKPWEEDGKWWQLVFQVRLNPAVHMDVKQGTLPGAFPTCPKRADENFSNGELEWVVKRPGNEEKIEWMRIYGIMLRVTDKHPSELPACQWWKRK